jgi:hypothetical protein
LPENAAPWQAPSPLLELTFTFVRFDHIASGIVNADHSPDVIDCDDLHSRLRSPTASGPVHWN